MDTACSGKEETKGMLLSTLAATCKMGNVDLSKMETESNRKIMLCASWKARHQIHADRHFAVS